MFELKFGLMMIKTNGFSINREISYCTIFSLHFAVFSIFLHPSTEKVLEDSIHQFVLKMLKPRSYRETGHGDCARYPVSIDKIDCLTFGRK